MVFGTWFQLMLSNDGPSFVFYFIFKEIEDILQSQMGHGINVGDLDRTPRQSSNMRSVLFSLLNIYLTAA